MSGASFARVKDEAPWTCA